MTTTQPKQPVLLDNSFLIRFLNSNADYHAEANEYYRYFLAEKIPMIVSVVALAEYGVANDISHLPLSMFRLKTFDMVDSTLSSKYAKALFEARAGGNLTVLDRRIIPNDVKLFAQATNTNCTDFVTKDAESIKLLNHIKRSYPTNFKVLDFSRTLLSEHSGMLLPAPES